MNKELKKKYQAFPRLKLDQRKWPDAEISSAPTWCSVDLRDGNQALINPMSQIEKLRFFKLLCEIGFKEIEIGFPSAADVEYNFCRKLIEDNLIPEDVTPQMLCQCREHLIDKSFAAIEGAKKVIFHIYNSTSSQQREIVFKKDRKEIIKIATDAVKMIKERAADFSGELTLEYSPESFTGTELEFAKEICESVMEIWQPTPDKKIILNLPATVELHTPNIHADQIEWFTENVQGRDAYTLSLHTHNDRGTGVAATELGLLAGADRVEGTLFGNGERTGNVDIVTLALNMLTQGVDPKLDFSNIMEVRDAAEQLTDIPVHQRHPYAGDLVFTAFSGSHQDAIKKGMDLQKESDASKWDVPYLPIDPQDIGRSYEAIIRINSQSGKGGVAYLLEQDFGARLPKAMHIEVSRAIQNDCERSGKELSSQEVWDSFAKNFINLNAPLEFVNFSYRQSDSDQELFDCELSLIRNKQKISISNTGNGPIDACKKALEKLLGQTFKLEDYLEHAMTTGSESRAIAYIQLSNGKENSAVYGAGIDSNTTKASVKALISACNRLF